MPTPFHLQKWYLDLVTDEGRVFIGYAVRIRWWLLTIHYHGYLYLDERGAVQHVHRYRRAKMPEQQDVQIAWQVAGVRGSWTAAQAAYHEKLLESEQGVVDWQCVMPGAVARVELEPHGVLTGQGYVEQLEMTLPPWKLPITTLHWGRYLSETDAVVWIRWESSTHPKTLIVHNGRRYEEGSIDAGRVQFGQNALCLSESQALRSGSLGSTVLARAGWIKGLIPGAVQRLRETKWRSRGSLEREGAALSSGWAIHEVVSAFN